MDDAQPGIPAGWYRDPQGMTRWYDGTAWTEHTQPVHWVMPQTGRTVRTTRADAVGDDLFVEPMGPPAAPAGPTVDGDQEGATDSARSPVLSGLVVAAVVLMAAIVVVLAVLLSGL